MIEILRSVLRTLNCYVIFRTFNISRLFLLFVFLITFLGHIIFNGASVKQLFCKFVC